MKVFWRTTNNCRWEKGAWKIIGFPRSTHSVFPKPIKVWLTQDSKVWTYLIFSCDWTLLNCNQWFVLQNETLALLNMAYLCISVPINRWIHWKRINLFIHFVTQIIRTKYEKYLFPVVLRFCLLIYKMSPEKAWKWRFQVGHPWPNFGALFFKQ